VAYAGGNDLADAPPAAAADQGGLGDIVVTATRQAQSVQKVPISMQALSTEKLEQRKVKGLSDIAALLPSVRSRALGRAVTAYFRGIVPAGGNYASVGYYLDDIPITGTRRRTFILRHGARRGAVGSAGHAVWRRLAGGHDPFHHQQAQAGQVRVRL
jgi:outer membrane receptor protein involved in Fe transport